MEVTTERIPSALEHLEAAFSTHGFQQEEMHSEYLRVRKAALDKIGEDLKTEEAYLDVRNFINQPDNIRKASQVLAQNASSPVVSKETQLAVLKQMMMDFMRGKKRPGLSALTALKAAEIINKMCGFDAPIEQKLTHEHKVTCLPVIEQPYKGELPPLKVIDVGEDDGMTTSIAVSEGVNIPNEDDLTLF